MSRSVITIVVALTLGVAAVHCQQPQVPQGEARGEAVPLQPLPVENLAFAEWNDTFPHLWARGEYLLWAIGTGKLAELGKETYSSQQFNALLNAAGKDYGDFVSHMLGNDRVGFRFSAGAWFDPEETLGLEASFTYLQRSPLVLPMQQPPLGRIGLPAFDNNDRQIVIPLTARALADGRVNVEIADQELWILDLLGRDRIYEGAYWAIDGLAGYRHIYYRDSLTVRSESVLHSPALLAGAHVAAVDQVTVENSYDGALLGLEFGAHHGGWSLIARPTATIAYLHADVLRAGYTGATVANQLRLQNYGGTYLRPEDVGRFSRHEWTVIPELALQLSRSIGEHVRISLGASLMYIPIAARAGDQLELGIDPTARVLPGAVETRIGQKFIVPDLKAIFLNTYSLGLELRY